jgi:hypothetical protein
MKTNKQEHVGKCVIEFLIAKILFKKIYFNNFHVHVIFFG